MKKMKKALSVLFAFALLFALLPAAPAEAAGLPLSIAASRNSYTMTVVSGGASAAVAAVLDGKTIAVHGLSEQLIETLRAGGGDVIVLDFNTLGLDISAATLTVEEFRALSHAEHWSPDLLLELPAGSVRFDTAALDFLSGKASGGDITLTLSRIPYGKLMPEQQAAVWELDPLAIFDLHVNVGLTYRAGSLGDGRAVVRFAPDGEEPGAELWHLASDGQLTRVPAKQESGMLAAELDHFSNYVVTRRPPACPQDETCPISAFRDADPAAWYHDGVHYVLENKLMGGEGDGSFAPDKPVTRAMIAQILWNMEGRPAYAGTSGFSDVAADAWYAPAVRWADAESVVDGIGEDRFGPDEALTREQLITILYRYANYKDVNVDAASELSRYTDADAISPWARSAMQWADASGLITGRTAAAIQPGDPVTRAEIATTVMRYCTQF